jgi:DNA-directed RNA polymerase subunit beta'
MTTSKPRKPSKAKAAKAAKAAKEALAKISKPLSKTPPPFRNHIVDKKASKELGGLGVQASRHGCDRLRWRIN